MLKIISLIFLTLFIVSCGSSKPIDIKIDGDSVNVDGAGVNVGIDGDSVNVDGAGVNVGIDGDSVNVDGNDINIKY